MDGTGTNPQPRPPGKPEGHGRPRSGGTELWGLPRAPPDFLGHRVNVAGEENGVHHKNRKLLGKIGPLKIDR